MTMQNEVFKSIDWNNFDDNVDLMTWRKLVEQFWLPDRMPISNDIQDWNKLPELEKDIVNKALAGLTMLDTLQSEDGNEQIKKDAVTQHEIAVYNNIQFMESVHAKSYSSIFSTLSSPTEISELFRWTEENEMLQYKALRIRNIYLTGTSMEKKIASVYLESFLFYSGFFAPLHYLGNEQLINVAEVIKLIIRDESVHGTYIGYKFRQEFDQLDFEEQTRITRWANELLIDLYKNEVKYTEYLYDEIGWTEDVKTFLKYNANKALMNLGLDTIFKETSDDVNPVVMNGISTSTTNHDFFSTVGNGYLLSEVEAMNDSDYNFMTTTVI